MVVADNLFRCVPSSFHREVHSAHHGQSDSHNTWTTLTGSGQAADVDFVIEAAPSPSCQGAVGLGMPELCAFLTQNATSNPYLLLARRRALPERGS